MMKRADDEAPHYAVSSVSFPYSLSNGAVSQAPSVLGAEEVAASTPTKSVLLMECNAGCPLSRSISAARRYPQYVPRNVITWSIHLGMFARLDR
jgi:hypothetical protein